MKKSYFGVLGAVTLALTACGGRGAPTVEGSNKEALQQIQNQKLNWEKCDPTVISPKVAKDLGDRMQCADIRVPMDWNNPSHGEASVSLLRVTAAKPDQRQGAIFFNPGGPGGDGLLFGAVFGYLWDKADTSTQAGAELKRLSEQYDLVGFSPRGVGDSSLISCGANRELESVNNPSYDRSKENTDKQLRNARLVAAACQKSPMSRFVNTEQTARDLNLARQLMGDKKLNYIGYSYGTWLGSWYAKLFPEQTGRMVLDGNTAFDKTLEESFLMQPLGFERAFRDVSLYFAARHNDLFELGQTKEEVYATYDALPPNLKYALQGYAGGSIIQNMYTDDGITENSLHLVAARGVSDVLKANPGAKDMDSLAPLLEKHQFAQNAQVNKVAQQLALPLAEAFFELEDGASYPLELSSSNATFTAVKCNDTPSTRDPQHWVDLGTQLAQKYPLIGGQYTEEPCIYWGEPTAKRPATPASMPPILMLHTESDPATPREGAISAWKSLPNAKLLMVDNEAKHTAFPYDTDCVDYPVAHYFTSGELPQQNFTACQALPLPGEDEVYPVGESYTTGIAPQSVGPQGPVRGAQKQSAFVQTEDVQQAKQLLKDIIERNAIARPGQQ
ncbi:alpha/beta hydrolase [Deinococcus sp. Marseille-Q6407]|uniref:alpha/beta hydrolase n=1 Tax=Deinococcus sp. Marseille-Q6407 TaxID=2969223 RepID=UPI0021C02AEC|nr:alpha/beta hydrolase [Deinococcus sp. Marseille-Q6407]